jgi:hypothetical protein
VIAEKCSIHGCEKSARKSGLCWMHYKRRQRHGHLEQTRPADWGAREKHPLYAIWTQLRRNYDDQFSPRWRDDFWAFAKDIGERPKQEGQRLILKREDETKPWGPKNWYWRKTVPRSENVRAEHREYMREYHAEKRSLNRDYWRNGEFKKRYGVGIDWYNARLAEQKNVCAICFKPETRSIRGKVFSLAVDHVHGTKQMRGLLCSDCNRGLGHFKDNPASLESAARYLRKHAAK